MGETRITWRDTATRSAIPMAPSVSVLIDTYNHERFIEEAVVSVLEQDFPAAEREIIVVDDGSTDSTPEVLRKFGSQIRVLRKTNGGQASAFNAGIPECQGEIVFFLDGDDWWAAGKLRAVMESFGADHTIGLVGHGITEVLRDRTERKHVLREPSRFRLDSAAAAREFRLRKGLLGTSRMAYRAPVLRKIGRVPETLIIQADEYLFTLAGLFSDVVIRREPLTYYRLHESNAFQITSGGEEALRKKSLVLKALAGELQKIFEREHVAREITETVVTAVQVESEMIRLEIENCFPWETIPTEWVNYRITHEEASSLRRFLKGVSLLPALVLPSRAYFRFRKRVTTNSVYRRARMRWLPFSQRPCVRPPRPNG